MTTWMIVEDDPNLYELMCEAFERWEIETLLFVEVEEALEWIDLVDQGHNVGELPELAMLDLLFHRVKLGHLVGQRLRASPVLNRLPIVIMSRIAKRRQSVKITVRRSSRTTISASRCPGGAS
ncbi:MAG: hypothetical protein UZ13_03626 [Chloroflexi bacterium OLB13]|nr:MAG: hypothetical protein UZ13_03626 [Chloroflexi bacterium OLB13]